MLLLYYGLKIKRIIKEAILRENIKIVFRDQGKFIGANLDTDGKERYQEERIVTGENDPGKVSRICVEEKSCCIVGIVEITMV